jgi:multiple antibiotic resistance protein
MDENRITELIFIIPGLTIKEPSCISVCYFKKVDYWKNTLALQTFINFYLKLIFILTPFFVLSAFLSLTCGLQDSEKKRIAVKVTIAVMISSFVIYLFGKYIFELFGITLDAFRIGAGTILFLSALSMISGRDDTSNNGADHDIAVVPLALPITVGPGVIGVLLVTGAEAGSYMEKLIIGIALFLAVLSVGSILYLSTSVKRLIGEQGLMILPKITGLFVSAIAAQIIFTGIQNFLNLT